VVNPDGARAGEASRPATMADVASRVGVSRQLVGLVFQGRPGVSEATRDRILDAARDLGYTPNAAARALRSSTTKSIGVAFDPAESAPADIVRWLHDIAGEFGYRLIVTTVTRSHDDVAALSELIGYRSEAVVLIAPRSPAADLQLTAGRTPVVVIGRRLAGHEFDVVGSRGDDGIAALVSHLADLGHSSIAFVDGCDMLDSEIRLSGYQRGMAQRGLTESFITIRGDYTEVSGALAADEVLANGVMPTAVMCNNDQAAFGLIHSLLRAGKRVPADISVTGFDDSRLAGMPFLDLTTARQDPQDMARAAIEAVISRIRSPGSPTTESLSEVTVIVRGSTSPPSHE
jgi:DNA-binding LacI/PurR family transcriptional regulator